MSALGAGVPFATAHRGAEGEKTAVRRPVDPGKVARRHLLLWKLLNWQSWSGCCSVCSGSRWAWPGVCTTLRSPAFACAYGLPAAWATVQRPLARRSMVDVFCRACVPLAAACCVAAQVSVDGTTVTTPGKELFTCIMNAHGSSTLWPLFTGKQPSHGGGKGAWVSWGRDGRRPAPLFKRLVHERHST